MSEYDTAPSTPDIAWCWTDNKQAMPFCFKEGHDVRGWRGMASPEPGIDPAVKQWRDATALRQEIIERARPKTHLEAVKAQRDEAIQSQRSTGARLRAALEANDALAKEHGLCVVEVERLRDELRRANDAGQQLVGELRATTERLNYATAHRDAFRGQRNQAWLEIDRLRAQLTVRPGGQYHLTDKGLAALAEPTDKEQP